LNYELFIAKRIIAGKKHKSSISSPIIKIAITAISLGMIIMLISVATSTGLQEKIRNKMAGFKGHILITNYDNNNSEISIYPLDKRQDFYPNFPNINGIENIQVFANKGGIIRTTTDFEGVLLKGVGTDYNWTFFKEYLQEGRLPNYQLPRNKEVLLSKTMVDKLQLHLNDTISVLFQKSTNSKLPSRRKYIIVGIYNSGFDQFDKQMMIGDIREVQRLNKWNENEIGGFEIVLYSFNDIDSIGSAVYKNIPSTLNSVTIKEAYPSVFEWIELFDNNVQFIIAIMILIAGINMITALLVLILERVKMIGILKALGSSNWSIRKIFLYNATYLILKGLFWGNLIGLCILFIQKHFHIISLDPTTYYVSSVPVSFNLWMILILNIGTLVLCFLMLLIPSVIITKISPSKSIRFS